MNNENFHPVLPVPPLAHALHRYDEATKTLFYEYNGVDVIKVCLSEADDAGFRHGSDGTMQSIQYIQQIYMTVERPMWVTLCITLSPDTVNMRPHRARSGEAILGQNGRLLIEGVNGLYDVDQDLLIDFNGCPWHWKSQSIGFDNTGKSVVEVEVQLSEKPFFINLRMHYYKNHLGYCYHEPWKRKPKSKPVSGWCSWEGYRRDINEENIRDICSFMDKNLRPWGLEYLQVDDGYQKMPLPFDASMTMDEGWMTCDEEKFPHGHAGIVNTIKESGLSPAIWVNANITNPEFPLHHPDDVLWHDGKPMKGEWIDYLYSCTPECLQKHVTSLFRRLKETGYTYVKIDAIRHLIFDGLHEAVRMGDMSNEEAQLKFRAYMQATRDGLGEDIYYLASWGEIHEVIGLCDACRISMDANPTWAGVHMQLFESARWFFTQRILFLNDPDHVCVRTKPEWAQSVLSLVSLSGGLYMLSDAKADYTEEKLSIIRKTLPPLRTRTAETGPLNLEFPAYTWTKLHGFAVQSNDKPVKMEEVSLKDVYDMAGIYPTMNDDHPFSSLWSFHLQSEREMERWCILARFATVPLKASTISLVSLGLPENDSYHAFDFWKEKYLGKVSGQFAARELSVGECQIVALRKEQTHPQFIASTRHVSMDAVSVTSCIWDEGILTVKLKGVPEFAERYYFCGNGRALKEAKADGAQISTEMTDGLICMNVAFQKEEVEIKLIF